MLPKATPLAVKRCCRVLRFCSFFHSLCLCSKLFIQYALQQLTRRFVTWVLRRSLPITASCSTVCFSASILDSVVKMVSKFCFMRFQLVTKSAWFTHWVTVLRSCELGAACDALASDCWASRWLHSAISSSTLATMPCWPGDRWQCNTGDS